MFFGVIMLIVDCMSCLNGMLVLIILLNCFNFFCLGNGLFLLGMIEIVMLVCGVFFSLILVVNLV